MRAINDALFIRGDIPMTKRTIRAYIMDALDIERGDIALDVGAGTGSVSVEMALRGAEVRAIEIEEEGISLINQNAEKFGVKIETKNLMAPDGIRGEMYDKIFIGGTKGRMKEIIDAAYDSLKVGGTIVLTFILPKNYTEAMALMHDFKEVESTLIQTSEINKIGMMIANNPIFLIRGVK